MMTEIPSYVCIFYVFSIFQDMENDTSCEEKYDRTRNIVVKLFSICWFLIHAINSSLENHWNLEFKYLKVRQKLLSILYEPVVPYTYFMYYFNSHGSQRNSPRGNIDHSAIQECRSKTRIVHSPRFMGESEVGKSSGTHRDSGSFCIRITERALLIQHRKRS